MRTLTICIISCILAALFVSGSNLNQDICLENSIKCFIDPCLIYECNSHPSAVCRANYCKGCHAEFFDGDQKVSCDA